MALGLEGWCDGYRRALLHRDRNDVSLRVGRGRDTVGVSRG